jgi:hypothetical protein
MGIDPLSTRTDCSKRGYQPPQGDGTTVFMDFAGGLLSLYVQKLERTPRY